MEDAESRTADGEAYAAGLARLTELAQADRLDPPVLAEAVLALCSEVASCRQEMSKFQKEHEQALADMEAALAGKVAAEEEAAAAVRLCDTQRDIADGLRAEVVTLAAQLEDRSTECDESWQAASRLQQQLERRESLVVANTHLQNEVTYLYTRVEALVQQLRDERAAAAAAAAAAADAAAAAAVATAKPSTASSTASSKSTAARGVTPRHKAAAASAFRSAATLSAPPSRLTKAVASVASGDGIRRSLTSANPLRRLSFDGPAAIAAACVMTPDTPEMIIRSLSART